MKTVVYRVYYNARLVREHAHYHLALKHIYDLVALGMVASRLTLEKIERTKLTVNA